MEAKFEEKLGDERVKIAKLEDERVKLEEKLEDQRVKIAKLEEERLKLEEKLEEEHAERQNQIAAEKAERIEQMNDFAERADDLEGWVITKVCFPYLLL